MMRNKERISELLLERCNIYRLKERRGGEGQLVFILERWIEKTVKEEKNVNLAFLCKVSRINGTKGQRERNRL